MNEDNVSAVEKIVLANRRVTVEDISSQLNISVGSVHAIIHDELHMNKVHTKWVPRILSSDMRQTRIDCSKELLQLCESNPSFLIALSPVMSVGYISMTLKVHMRPGNGSDLEVRSAIGLVHSVRVENSS